MGPIRPDSEVQRLDGVGPRTAATLAEAGIRRVEDLLLRLPFRYEDRSEHRAVRELVHGEEAAVQVVIESVTVRPTRRHGLRIVELRGRDETGPVRATWFNQAHLKQVLRPGQRVLLFGNVKQPFAGAVPEIMNPRYERVDSGPRALLPCEPAPAEPPPDPGAHAGRIVPIYERVGRVSPRLLRTILHRLFESEEAIGPGWLPEELCRRLGLMDRRSALREVHFPSAGTSLPELAAVRSPAHRRLILEDFFPFALGFQLRRLENRTGRPDGHLFTVDDELRQRARQVLPFTLTKSQRDALSTIAKEFQSPWAMRRLLQGDVGSGKTIVAVIAALIVLHHGAQVALMAPTEVLAEQHFITIRRLLEPHRIRVALLTASLGARDRRDTLRALESGWAQFVVGTHSLIQEGARFRDLGFAIVDEQHRFGRAQRYALAERGGAADLLVMTATPIPRTLTTALHGDLDLSELRELPPGRRPVRTRVLDWSGFPEAIRIVLDAVRHGHQAFYVCPTIDESEHLPGAGVEARLRELVAGPLRGLRVEPLHGRIPRKQRESVMDAFVRGETDVLVATTVIEVGVDVPNATVLVVEHAERFGLATLHQLRGRVGRGSAPATAVLVSGENAGAAEERLRILEETADGFRIAEKDLEIRGPSDFRGTRQHGIPPFPVADIVRDADFLRLARKEAVAFLASPAAETPEGRSTIGHVRAIWGDRFGLAAAG